MGNSMGKLQVTLLLVLSSLAFGAAADDGDMYRHGRTHLTVGGGKGRTFDNNYTAISLSASYYAMDGLALGISYESWTGGDRHIIKYAPSVQYVFYESTMVQPYVGVFYRHTGVDGLPDIDSLGESAGINIPSGDHAYVSIGFVHEAYLGCQQTIYSSCSVTYSNIGVSYGF
jgi:hypothetical protein